jgi:hypothetical protein
MNISSGHLSYLDCTKYADVLTVQHVLILNIFWNVRWMAVLGFILNHLLLFMPLSGSFNIFVLSVCFRLINFVFQILPLFVSECSPICCCKLFILLYLCGFVYATIVIWPASFDLIVLQPIAKQNVKSYIKLH